MEFIYAVNKETTKYILDIHKEKWTLEDYHLVIGDNIEHKIVGSDNICCRLDYSDKIVYYFNTYPNKDLKNISCTYLQVVLGIYSALFTIMYDKLPAGIHYAEDLVETFYSKFLTDNMVIQEFVFEKGKTGHKLVSHIPHIKYWKWLDISL